MHSRPGAIPLTLEFRTPIPRPLAHATRRFLVPTVGGRGTGRFQACNRLKPGFPRPRNAYEPRHAVSYFPLHGLHVKPRAGIHHVSSVIHYSSVIHVGERHPGLKPCPLGWCSGLHLWVMGERGDGVIELLSSGFQGDVCPEGDGGKRNPDLARG